ncbi:response regulator transcription factor [Roseococcus sp. DSY-14]|uniref:response regulator transcription factor n=1 Tax=Roseococcus sp. DSY-14 TaxID=3369650 RepID=UPI00387B4BB2
MPIPRRILLLTDDAALARFLPQQLAPEGYALRVAPAGPAGDAEAVLLDAALPPSPEAHLAALDGGVPVLLLGHAPGEPPGAPLPAGAAERLAKPLRLAGLLPRLRARLAAWDASPGAATPLGPFSFHFAGRLLTAADGARIRLTETEAAILAYLHRAGRPVPREELLGEVWGYSAAVATHTLETHIYRLRRKLGQAAELLRREDGGYRIA